MMLRRKVALLVGLLLAIGSLQWAFPNPASADLTDDEWATREARLDYWADEMIGPLDSNDVATLDWFVDIRYNVELNNIKIYTSGFGNQISQSTIQAAAAEGITINEYQKPKSLQTMLTEQRNLSDQMEQDGVITGSNTIDINPSGDQSLTVTTNSASMAADEVEGADTDAEAAELYGEYLSEKLDTEVNVVLQENRDPVSATRQNDSSPWYGGAGLTTPSGGYCSSGFGARRTVGSVTTHYLLTAYHCGSGTYKDRAGQTIGSVGSLSSAARAADAAAIQISGGGTAGSRMFDGAWNNSSNYSKPVGSRGNARIGKRVCSSGAMSGVHCYLRVYKTNSRVKYTNGQIVFGLVKAEQENSGIAVARGDSGGPVFGPHEGAFVKVKALGIVSGGDLTLTCTSTYSSTTCFKLIFFQPVKTALTLYGATLNYS